MNQVESHNNSTVAQNALLLSALWEDMAGGDPNPSSSSATQHKGYMLRLKKVASLGALAGLFQLPCCVCESLLTPLCMPTGGHYEAGAEMHELVAAVRLQMPIFVCQSTCLWPHTLHRLQANVKGCIANRKEVIALV